MVMGLVNMGFLLACGPAPQDSATPVTATPIPLDNAALLRRASLDLRGRPPSLTELDRLEQDPGALPDLLDHYVQDPTFGPTLMDRYALLYRTRVNAFVVGVDGDYDLLNDPAAHQSFVSAVGLEPLQILQRVASENLPYTDLVTGDWTMTTERLAESWPVEPIGPPNARGWMLARYTDGRPQAGVLVSNGLWWRYTSTSENRNRGRAEAVARILLCDERYSDGVDFSQGEGTAMALEDRASSEASCLGCHAALDPIGSYLWGFWRNHPESFTEAASYYPARELMWQTQGGPEPALYGQPGASLYDLGQQIAADPRFSECAVRQGFEGLLGRPAELQDTAALTEHREAFIQGDLTLRTLYRSLVDDPLYRSADPDFTGTTPKRLMSPALLARQVESLTGFSWTWEGGEMMSNDTSGVRLLAGGADGLLSQTQAQDYSLTSVLVQQRLAEGASAFVVEQDSLSLAADRRLFGLLTDLSSPPKDSVLRAQINDLCRSTWSRSPSPQEEEGLVALWEGLYESSGSAETAWTLLLSGLLRHPDFMEY
ncbi:MAG: hypothetical protein ACI9VR_001796 [Cognaticolwellia sp.]|jgi:hypothetical protein